MSALLRSLLQLPIVCVNRQRLSTVTCAGLLTLSLPTSAQTPWPPELTRHYTTQCKLGLVAQGQGQPKASEICECMAVGLSREFGMEGFDNMQTARPNPRGSFHDRRFYVVASSCYNPVLKRF